MFRVMIIRFDLLIVTLNFVCEFGFTLSVFFSTNETHLIMRYNEMQQNESERVEENIAVS